MRLPSATVQMQINNRGAPVAIDLPRYIGCPLYRTGKQRYVMLLSNNVGEKQLKDCSVYIVLQTCKHLLKIYYTVQILLY